MWFVSTTVVAEPFEETDPLPSRLLEDAAGDDILQLRRDAVRAAKVLQEVQPALAFTIPAPLPTAGLRGFKWLWVAAAIGLAAGLLLAYVLAHTVWAPAYECHSFPASSFSCVRTGAGG